MSRYSAVLAVAAAAVLAVPTVAGAAPVPPVLTLTGAANSAVSWTVTKPVTLSIDTLGGGMTVTGGKTYVGLAVHDIRGRLLAAAVSPAAFTLHGEPLLVWLGSRRPSLQLAPGQYRLTLVADAPATVRVRTRGLTASTTVRTTRQADGVSAAVFTMRADAPLTVSGRTRLKVTAGSRYGVFTYTRKSAPSEEEAWFCLRPSPSTCGATDNDFRTSSTTLSAGGESTSASSMWTVASESGAFDAAAGMTTAAITNTAAGFAMSITGG